MKTAFVIVAAIAAAFAPTAAQAGGLGDLASALLGSGTSYGGYYSSPLTTSCDYGTAASKLSCRIDQFNRIGRSMKESRERKATQQAEKMQAQTRVADALVRACKAGDASSCQRTASLSQTNTQIMSALIDACRAGDEVSCRRMDGDR